MTAYNYNHFKLEDYAHDHFDAPKIGERAPDFTAYTLEGKEVKLADYFLPPPRLRQAGGGVRSQTKSCGFCSYNI